MQRSNDEKWPTTVDPPDVRTIQVIGPYVPVQTVRGMSAPSPALSNRETRAEAVACRTMTSTRPWPSLQRVGRVTHTPRGTDYSRAAIDSRDAADIDRGAPQRERRMLASQPNVRGPTIDRPCVCRERQRLVGCASKHRRDPAVSYGELQRPVRRRRCRPVYPPFGRRLAWA